MDLIPIEVLSLITRCLDVKSFVLFVTCNKRYRSELLSKSDNMIFTLFRTVYSNKVLMEDLENKILITWIFLTQEFIVNEYMIQELINSWIKIVGFDVTRSLVMSIRENDRACIRRFEHVALIRDSSLCLFRWLHELECDEVDDATLNGNNLTIVIEMHNIPHPWTKHICFVAALSGNKEILNYLHKNGCCLTSENLCSSVYELEIEGSWSNKSFSIDNNQQKYVGLVNSVLKNPVVSETTIQSYKNCLKLVPNITGTIIWRNDIDLRELNNFDKFLAYAKNITMLVDEY